MHFFLGGELDVDVSDAHRPVRNSLEKRLNAFLADRDYGGAICKIAVIPMILRPEWQAGRPERRLFQRKQRSADYRTTIDFEKFKNGNDTTREQLLLKNIVDAVADLARKAGKGFDGRSLITDILDLFSVTPQELDRL